MSRDLVRTVLAEGWLPTAPADIAEIDQALAELETKAIKELEPKLDGEASAAVDRNLRPIGAKILPTAPPGAVKEWRMAMLMALSDLPPRIAAYATAKAIHTPFNFLNEVELEVRRIAAEAIDKQRTAAWRLKMWRAELERAMNPAPALEAPSDERVAAQEIDEFNATMRASPHGIRTRLRLGEDGKPETYLLSDDEAEAERQAMAENGDV
jgi:hypothetical protein